MTPQRIKDDANKIKTKKINTVRRNQEINRRLIDILLKKKHCTLLTVKKFICEDFIGQKLVKGKEKWCLCPDYVNCPAFNHYVNHEMIKNRRKVTAGEAQQEKKRKRKEKNDLFE